MKKKKKKKPNRGGKRAVVELDDWRTFLSPQFA